MGDRHYLIDAGLGAARRMGQAGLKPSGLSGMVITHLHSDHLFDLFNVLWMQPDRLRGPLPVHGPGRAGGFARRYSGKSVPMVRSGKAAAPGTEDMFEGLLSAYAYDMNIRNVEVGAQIDEERLFDARDIRLPAGTNASATDTAPATLQAPPSGLTQAEVVERIGLAESTVTPHPRRTGGGGTGDDVEFAAAAPG